jgi:D-alanyl-D-alanine carboxypeptidase
MNDFDVEPLRRAARSAVVGSSLGGVRRQASVGGAGADTPFRIASLTKPLTAVGTLLAARRSGVGTDTPVLDVLPALRDDWAADRHLTIGEVLAQTSGLASTVTADDVLRLGESAAVTVETARLVVRAGSARPPGLRWEYYNGNYFLAGAVVAALMETTYEDALDDLVLRPWGLGSTSFRPPADLVPGVDQDRPVPAATYPRGRRPSGGLCSTAGDLLTFGEHLLDDPDLLAQVRTARTRPDDPMRYGLGWAIGPSGQLYLNGRLPGYRAALMLVPDHDLVAVALAAASDALPALAGIVSAVQHGLTGDHLAEAIDAFAA